MTTPLKREAVKALLDECGSADCLTCEYATALLAARDERDALRKEFDAVVAMLSEMHGAEYSRAEAAEAKLAEYSDARDRQFNLICMLHAKLAERDAENARLREALGHAQYGLSWALARDRDANPPYNSDPCPPITRALDLIRAALNKEPTS